MQIVLDALDDALDKASGKAQGLDVCSDVAAQGNVYGGLHHCQHLNDGGLLSLYGLCYFLVHFDRFHSTKRNVRGGSHRTRCATVSTNLMLWAYSMAAVCCAGVMGPCVLPVANIAAHRFFDPKKASDMMWRIFGSTPIGDVSALLVEGLVRLMVDEILRLGIEQRHHEILDRRLAVPRFETIGGLTAIVVQAVGHILVADCLHLRLVIE